VAREESLQDTITTRRSITDRHSGLSRGSAKFNTCLLHVVAPTDEGCNQPLSSGPKTHLNTTVFCFALLYPACEESPQLGASRPYNMMFTKKHGVREGWATHTRHKIRATIRTQVTARALNTTQRVLYSNGALVAITKNRMHGIEVLVLKNA
jgi:hypothetical protein